MLRKFEYFTKNRKWNQIKYIYLVVRKKLIALQQILQLERGQYWSMQSLMQLWFILQTWMIPKLSRAETLLHSHPFGISILTHNLSHIKNILWLIDSFWTFTKTMFSIVQILCNNGWKWRKTYSSHSLKPFKLIVQIWTLICRFDSLSI